MIRLIPNGRLVLTLGQIMHIYCQNKETQDLKDLANSILRKPAVINSISMFVRPAYWLSPLCSLLDEWRWDEIHGESIPPSRSVSMADGQ